MPPLVLPTLVNESSGDPAVFVPFSYHRQAYLFDIGTISRLSPRNLLKITHVFVSHTHMDHFIGFDNLLRVVLGRDKILHFFGPEGFIANVEGKLSGYTWNLVGNYSNALVLKVTEVTDMYVVQRSLACHLQFRAVSEDTRQNTASPVILHQEASHRVNAVILDHGLPCLGFSLKENYRINIRKDMLIGLGITAGPWLQQFKQSIYEGRDPDAVISVPSPQMKSGKKTFRFGDLAEQLAVITRGQKISYIADVAYTRTNIEKILRLAGDSDHLFIEAPFLDADRNHATEKKHLTARQAGHIAGLVNAGRFTLFHFSPRYEQTEAAFYEEAREAYEKALKSKGVLC